MRFLIRTGTFAVLLAVFFALVALLSWAATYVTAERYAPGDTPSRLFALVAAPDGKPPYELMYWPQYSRKDPPPPPWPLRLPEASGEFSALTAGGYKPQVHFSTTELADGRQRVNVKVTDEDYIVYSIYVTDGKKVLPETFRIWGPTSALIAMFPAFVLTLVLGRVVRRRLQHSAGATVT